MNLRLSVRTKLFAVALVAASMLLLAGGALHASNMGFKMNKVIYPLGIDPAGRNLVALPFRNPYANFQQLCDALGVDGLGGVAGQTRVEQIDAATGNPVGHFCGDAGPLALLQRVGVEVKQPKGAPQVSGILVGSHAGGPPGVTFFAKGLGAIGRNRYPVLYHGTAATARDVCTQAGMVAPAKVQRIDSSGGAFVTYQCGDAGTGFNLILGEAVEVFDLGATIAGFVPPHF